MNGKSIDGAELYDPQTGKWTTTGSLREARNSGNTATLLHDGRALLAGGHSNKHVIQGAELYDPATAQWSDTESHSIGRVGVATLLADGRVLLHGGIDWFIEPGKSMLWPKSTIPKPARGPRPSLSTRLDTTTERCCSTTNRF